MSNYFNHVQIIIIILIEFLRQRKKEKEREKKDIFYIIKSIES